MENTINYSIRDARVEDAKDLLQIYAPYVTDTAVTFEYDVPSEEEFRERIENTLKKYPYLVATVNNIPVAYCYAGVFKNRAAYNHCVETSIYVDPKYQGYGIGTALYQELEKRLRPIGILNVNACISFTDVPNEYLTCQSPEFHARRGYETVAHFHKCGFKFGRWFDMICMEKMIGPHD